MITEETAKTKWCPLANAHGDSALRWMPRDNNGNWQHTLCIGSACMAWRWMPGRPENATSGEQFKGYCGAFGGPSS